MAGVTSTGLSKALINDLLGIYIDAENKMLEKLAKRAKRGVTEEGWTEQKAKDIMELRSEIEKISKESSKLAKAITDEGIIKAYKRGILSASKQLGMPKSVMKELVPYHIQRLILDTHNLMEGANVQILRNVNDTYRSVISESSTGVLVGTDTRLQATQDALNRFADKGITSFIDKAGRKWETASYAEMAVRTVTARAALQGHIDRQAELGYDLIQISSIGTTCPICMKWQGKVLSIEGKTPGYPTLELAKADGLFHPNCKHTILAYDPDIKDAPKPIPPRKDAEWLYEKTQEQRRNERQIRLWKRREAVALTDVEKIKAQRKIRYWQKQQRELIEETGLRRNYGREGIRSRVGDANKVRDTARPKIDKTRPKPMPKPMEDVKPIKPDVEIKPKAEINPLKEKPKKEIKPIKDINEDILTIKTNSDFVNKTAQPYLKNLTKEEQNVFVKTMNKTYFIEDAEYAAGFRPSSGVIEFSKKFTKDKDDWFKAGGIFHETFHKFDYDLNGGTFNKFRSWKTVKEVGLDKKGFALAKDEKLQNSIKKEIKKIPKREQHFTESLFNDLTRGKGIFHKGGHDEEYFSKTPTGTMGSEILANYSSLRALGAKDAIDLIDKYVPEVKKAYNKIFSISENNVPILVNIDDIPSLKNLSKTQEEFIKSKKININSDKMKNVKSYLEQAIENGDFKMRIPDEETLDKIINSKFKNQMEVGKSRGSYMPDVRKEASNFLFGTEHKTADDKDFEKYGYIGNKNNLEDINDSSWNGPSQYGDIIVIFKRDRVYNRTTFTVDDSLGPAFGGHFVSSKVDNVMPVNISKGAADLLNNPVHQGKVTPNWVVKNANVRYVEAQYHGDLTIDDVEAIVDSDYSNRRGKPLSNEIIKKLKDKGIKVQYYDPKDKKIYDY